MATKKSGILTSAGEWWVHLRPYLKRQFWKSERKATRKDTKKQIKENES